MGQLVGGAQPLGGYVGIALGGRKARVAKYLLDRTQIGSPGKQMSCGRVAQAVRRDVVYPRELAHFVNGSPHLALVHAASTLSQEEGTVRAVAHESGPATVKPLDQRATCGDTKRDNSFLRTLAKHTHEPLIQVHVANVETRELAHAHTRCVEQFSDGPITHMDRVLVIAARFGHLEQGNNSVGGDHRWHRDRRARRGEA